MLNLLKEGNTIKWPKRAIFDILRRVPGAMFLYEHTTETLRIDIKIFLNSLKHEWKETFQSSFKNNISIMLLKVDKYVLKNQCRLISYECQCKNSR